MPTDSNHAPYKQCTTCSSLSDQEYATQKYGWEENDTHLPEAAGRLTVVRDFRPNSSRALELWQCPECGTYYLYEIDYEYLVNGTEDEQTLTRLTQEQASDYLDRPAPA